MIAGNSVDAVPGPGLALGWGPYLGNVVATGNVLSKCDIGIAVSVADGAGSARLDGNLVSGATRAGIAGTAWTDIVATDLVADAGHYPHETATVALLPAIETLLRSTQHFRYSETRWVEQLTGLGPDRCAGALDTACT